MDERDTYKPQKSCRDVVTFSWITAFGASQDDVFQILNGEGPQGRILSNSRQGLGITGKSQLKRFGSFFGLKLGYYYRVVGKLM